MGYFTKITVLGILFSFSISQAKAFEPVTLEQTLRVVEELKGDQLHKAYRAADKSPFLKQMVTWYQALNPGPDTPFSIYTNLLQYHAHDLPRHAKITRRAEKYLIKRSIAPNIVLKWFDLHFPKTYDGLNLYVDTLLKYNNHLKVREVVRKFFHLEKLHKKDEKKFILKYKKFLTRSDVFNYIKSLLHSKDYDRASDLKSYLSKEEAMVFDLMLAFYKVNDEKVEVLFPKVSKTYVNDPDFIMAKFHYDKKKDHLNAILHFLRTHKPTPKTHKTHIHARKYSIRELMKEKKYGEALKLSQHHGLMPGLDKADLDWTAGWLYLRFLNKPQEAYTKFTHLYNEVTASISKARGAYWSGRAAFEMGHKKEAEVWFQKAFQYGATFYGQMAAVQLKKKPRIVFLKPKPLIARMQNYLIAAKAFEKVGLKDYTEMFLRHLMKQSLTPAEQAYVAHQVSEYFKRYDVAALISRLIFKSSSHVIKEGYPLLNYPLGFHDPALVHAVILQESRFEQNLIGSTDDYGLMQIIPPTAMRLCKKFSIPYDLKRLTVDGPYNVKLGSLYLNELSNDYSNSYPLMAAGYNAGEKAVNRWVETYGDPRKGQVDIIDWIELIPYSGTRNYVQRVIENVTVYRAIYPQFPKPFPPQTNLTADWRIF